MEIPEGKSVRDSVLSETISFLRFPLIVLVVTIHSMMGAESALLENFPIAEFVCIGLLKEGISSVAVPLFFFFAGFLFFRNADWNLALYKKKIRSRVSTIVIPFLVWSILAMPYVVTKEMFYIPEPRPMSEFIPELLASIFYSHNGINWDPLVFQFWFIRDLFVVCLFSPVWHFFLKRKFVGEIFVAMVGIVWIICRQWLPALSPVSIFFFCAGAYFSIHGRDFTQDFQKIGIVATVLALPLLVADATTKGEAINWWLHHAFILVGCVSLVFWASRGVATGKLRSSTFLSGSVFMVYAGHAIYFFAGPFHKLCNAIYVPTNDLGMIVLYFFEGIFSILFWLGVYWCLRRWFPKSLRLLTGGR